VIKSSYQRRQTMLYRSAISNWYMIGKTIVQI